MNNHYRSWVEISSGIFEENINLLKSKLKQRVKFAGVVKANAYGHGIIPMSKILLKSGATFLAVAYIDEALELRKNNIYAPILMLSQPLIPDINLVIRYNITPAVYDLDFAERLSCLATKENKIVPIHIKVETGLNRLGIKMDGASEIINKIAKLSGIRIEGIYTHFANAFSTNLNSVEKQLLNFDLVIKQLKDARIKPKYIHAANSAAYIWLPKSQYNLVRFGLAMYGLQPSDKKRYPLPVRQFLTWKTKILQIKEIDKGENVGYGNKHQVLKKMRIATIAIGYADGFRRGPFNFKHVLCNGHRAKIIGDATMSQSMIDISNIPNVSLDTEIVIIGKQEGEEITFEDIAKSTKTINEEIAVSISPLIPRVWL